MIRVTKSGKTQVRLRSGLFKWLATPPGEVIGTIAQEPGVNAFTGEPVEGPRDIPVRNIPPQEKPKGIPIPVPGGTVKDGKWSAQGFADAIKDHTPQILAVTKGLMSKKEAEESRQHLADAIYEGFKLMDKFISGTTVNHPTVVIWSNITDGELYTLADSWLYRAQVSKRDAERARRLIALHKQMKVGAILIPRFAKTWMTYTQWGFELPGKQTRQRRGVTRR